MRLSALVIVSLLFVSSPLIAEHSSGGGGSVSSGSSASSGGSSGSSSHSSSSGGSSSGASSSSRSSGSSHNSSTSASHFASTRTGTSSSPSSKLSPRENATQEKKVGRSFWHPFRKTNRPVADYRRPIGCVKGRCPICPPGHSRNGGACIVTSASCAAGQPWNGFGCGTQYWSNDCASLANQLAAMRRQMQGQNDAGQSLIYRTLQSQYESCLARYGLTGFNSYADLFDNQ